MNRKMIKPNVNLFRVSSHERRDFSLKIETKKRDIFADYYGSHKPPYAVIYGETYLGVYTPETLEKLALSKFK